MDLAAHAPSARAGGDSPADGGVRLPTEVRHRPPGRLPRSRDVPDGVSRDSTEPGDADAAGRRDRRLAEKAAWLAPYWQRTASSSVPGGRSNGSARSGEGKRDVGCATFVPSGIINRFHRPKAASNGAFHRGGPAGGRPIARQGQILDGRLLRRAEAIHSRQNRKHGRRLGNHPAVQTRSCGSCAATPARPTPTRGGPRPTARRASLGQPMRGADDDLAMLWWPRRLAGIAPRSRLCCKHPLTQPADQNGMGQPCDRTVEPEVNGRDRRRLDPLDVGQRRHRRQEVVGKQRLHVSPGHGHDHAVELSSRAVGQDDRTCTPPVPFDLSDRRAQMYLDALVGQPLAHAIVKDRTQRQTRQHQIARRRVTPEIRRKRPSAPRPARPDRPFRPARYQNHRPEAFDGPIRLAVAAEPIADGLPPIPPIAMGGRLLGAGLSGSRAVF